MEEQREHNRKALSMAAAGSYLIEWKQDMIRGMSKEKYDEVTCVLGRPMPVEEQQARIRRELDEVNSRAAVKHQALALSPLL